MAISKIKAEFSSDIKDVWDLVVSPQNYSWRSDIDKVTVTKPNEEFIEYTKDGYSTTFTITALEPLKRYEFDVENNNIIGHWVGVFSYENGKTTIDFTEYITSKKLILKPFVGAYLKKMQAAYIADLRKALDSQPKVNMGQ